MERKLNGEVVVFKTGGVSVICPKCNYYNKMSGIRRFGTCRRCHFVIDPRVKFLYEIDKLISFKARERRNKREMRRSNYVNQKSNICTFNNKA